MNGKPPPTATGLADGDDRGALLCLTRDEAAFLDAAFARILGDGCIARGSTYVDLTLWEADRLGAATPTVLAPGIASHEATTAYRVSIGTAQDLAVLSYGRRFQHLCGEQQDALLMMIEAGDPMVRVGECTTLTDRLVSDAAEAYFSSPVESEPQFQGAAR